MFSVIRFVGFFSLALAVTGILVWQNYQRISYDSRSEVGVGQYATSAVSSPERMQQVEIAADAGVGFRPPHPVSGDGAELTARPVEPIALPEIKKKPNQPEMPKTAIVPEKMSSLNTSSSTSSVQLEASDEAQIFSAVVKVQCPAPHGGNYIGSGFSIGKNKIVTAAHVVMDSATTSCIVIFPRDRAPVHYLRGEVQNIARVRQRHDEEGIDVAVLLLPPIETYSEARAIFTEYPAIPFDHCTTSEIIGDKTVHYGYPSNYLNQNFLSRLGGEIESAADIVGMETAISENQAFVYKAPKLSYSLDETVLHPYLISRVPSFYGDSGGLAINASKRCIFGPHRGGTIGNSAGENFTLLFYIGWGQVLDY